MKCYSTDCLLQNMFCMVPALIPKNFSNPKLRLYHHNNRILKQISVSTAHHACSVIKASAQSMSQITFSVHPVCWQIMLVVIPHSVEQTHCTVYCKWSSQIYRSQYSEPCLAFSFLVVILIITRKSVSLLVLWAIWHNKGSLRLSQHLPEDRSYC